MKVYLCGPINGRSDADCKDWREQAATALKAAGIEVVDPMARDFRGKEGLNVRAIVEGDKADIDGCDWLLVYYDQPSVGTSMEVIYAYERFKGIIIVNASGKASVSPWLTYHANHIVPSLSDALSHLTSLALSGTLTV